MTLRIGSICTGYGGLDHAVQTVFGGELAWVADNDPGAAAILAHHWPNVPNMGDVKAVDWRDAPPVDIFCAGFPCQDISNAGRGEGIQEGNRSGLWHTIADALGVLRPRVVVLENVAAIVARRPGMDVVLGDLARLGFDAEWACVRASDVGAPHRRERWFLLAWAPDAEGAGWQGTDPQRRWAARDGFRAVAHAADFGYERRRPARDWRPGSSDRGHAVADAPRLCHQDQPRDNAETKLVAEFGAGDRASHRRAAEGAGEPGGSTPVVAWGAYEPAIRRWERILGRLAPHPTIAGTKGQPKLNPVFVEWMQGLDAGHVTGVPCLSDNQMLRALGNGVVPAQAAYALRLLLARAGAEGVAA